VPTIWPNSVSRVFSEIDHFGKGLALLFHHQHVRRLQVAVDHALLVRVLHGAAHGPEQLQPLCDRLPLAVAVLRDGQTLDVLHDEVRPPLAGGAGIEDPRDIGVIHHRQRLPLISEAGQDLVGVHPEFYYFEGDISPNGFALRGQVHRAHASFA
jgi:hypothetical protein